MYLTLCWAPQSSILSLSAQNQRLPFCPSQDLASFGIPSSLSPRSSHQAVLSVLCSCRSALPPPHSLSPASAAEPLSRPSGLPASSLPFNSSAWQLLWVGIAFRNSQATSSNRNPSVASPLPSRLSPNPVAEPGGP